MLLPDCSVQAVVPHAAGHVFDPLVVDWLLPSFIDCCGCWDVVVMLVAMACFMQSHWRQGDAGNVWVHVV